MRGEAGNGINRRMELMPTDYLTLSQKFFDNNA